MSFFPTTAMILAAGRGTRMRHLSLERPKPLIEVAGRTLIDRILDHLKSAGIKTVVVNIHYLSEMLEAHLALRDDMDLHLVKERDLLETGGGVAHALPLLGSDPFFCLNADALWRDGPSHPTLVRLAKAWNCVEAEGLLLLRKIETNLSFQRGDFLMTTDTRLRRPVVGEQAPFQYVGVQILNPVAFDRDKDWPPIGSWSLNRLYDRASNRGKLYGIIHDGAWWHVGTPEDLATATRDLLTV